MDGLYFSWRLDDGEKPKTVRDRLLRDARRHEREFGVYPNVALVNPIYAHELGTEVEGITIRTWPCILDDEVRLRYAESA